MRLFCSGCRTLFSSLDAFITDPNVRASGGTAATFHPWCYAEASEQITKAESDVEAIIGMELPKKHRRRSANFAALSALAGRSPDPEPVGKKIERYRLPIDDRVKRTAEVNSDYATYPD